MPSRRSRTPPCPGMRWLASLTPNRRLVADFEQVAGLRREAEHEALRQRCPEAPAGDERENPADHHRRNQSAECARPGLAGADRRPELRPAIGPPGEIGAHIRGRDHEHEPEDMPRSRPGPEPEQQAEGPHHVEGAERQPGRAPRRQHRHHPAAGRERHEAEAGPGGRRQGHRHDGGPPESEQALRQHAAVAGHHAMEFPEPDERQRQHEERGHPAAEPDRQNGDPPQRQAGADPRPEVREPPRP